MLHEELRLLDERVAHRAAVDDHERPALARRLLDDGAREHVLAGPPVSPSKQDRRLRGRDALEHTEDGAHREALSERGPEARLVARKNVGPLLGRLERNLPPRRPGARPPARESASATRAPSTRVPFFDPRSPGRAGPTPRVRARSGAARRCRRRAPDRCRRPCRCAASRGRAGKPPSASPTSTGQHERSARQRGDRSPPASRCRRRRRSSSLLSGANARDETLNGRVRQVVRRHQTLAVADARGDFLVRHLCLPVHAGSNPAPSRASRSARRHDPSARDTPRTSAPTLPR